MAKSRYVEAKIDGYYGGKRTAGKKFWITDGKADFSKKWMKDAKPDPAVPAPAEATDKEAELLAQIAEHVKATEAVEAARAKLEDELNAMAYNLKEALEAYDLQKIAATEAIEAAKVLVEERDKLVADLEATAKDAKPAPKGGPSLKDGASLKA